MQFWQHVSETAGMKDSFHWVIAGVIVAAVALFAFRPRERRRVRAAVFHFAFAFVGMLAGAALRAFGFDAAHVAYVATEKTNTPDRFTIATASKNCATPLVVT